MAKKKKSENATTSRRKTVYELVGERRPLVRMGVDPIDDILLEEERELAREHKRLRLEQIVEKRRREVEKMREGGIDSGPLPSNQDFLNMAKLMVDLSPEEAQRVRSAYTFFKMADKGGGGGMSLFPMLLSYAKTNPGASEDQMIKYLALMDSQMVKGMEMMKAANPPKSQGDPVDYMVKGMELMKSASPNPASAETNAVEFLKLMKELVIEGVRNPLLQAIEKSQPQTGVFEQILTNPEMRSAAKEMGMFGGRSEGGAASEMDLKIAQVTTANQLEITKLNLDMKKSLLEMETKDRRSDNMMALINPISALLAGPVAQRMQQLGEQQGAAHMPPSAMPPLAPPTGTTILVRCTCGYESPMTFPGSPPPIIKCPSCGLDLNVTAPATA